MYIDFLLEAFRDFGDKQAIVWRDEAYTYNYLIDQIGLWSELLEKAGVSSGNVVAIERDFSPEAVGLFLALIDAGAILAPFTSDSGPKLSEYLSIAQAEFHIPPSAAPGGEIVRLETIASHEIYDELRKRRHPGLVLFSSGSTGQPKAAVHDVLPLLERFKAPKRTFRSISFLLYDHIGGINTMLRILANGGCLVTVANRSVEGVLETIQKHKVQLLPTTPTFLNLLLVSGICEHYDLSSLKVISYGTEPMLESTLSRLAGLLGDDVRLVQTYGLSEVGILSSKSKSSDSLWMKLGGAGFELRVVDDILHIKSETAMLGYLNAPSPFTSDGWMITGDRVEVDGEYYRILGRGSEMINVGGLKVFPAEIESVIQKADNVAQVSVYGEKNPLTGQIVCAQITLESPEDRPALTRRIKAICREKLERFKIPVKISIVSDSLHNARFKKRRNIDG